MLNFTQISFTLDILAFICILDFFHSCQLSNSPICFGASFCILSLVLFFFNHIHTINSLSNLRNFYFSSSIKIFGRVQCFSLLSFLPPLTNFGLVTPIPVGIRVLDVEHP